MDISLPLPLRALIVGFTIAAAVGPISLLVIRRTIAHGRAYGLASGLGVAMADATYAGIAAFGLTAVTSTLVAERVWLELIGGSIIVVLGIRIMRSKPGEVAEEADRPGLVGAYVSIYGLTMTNPATILAFGAVFAGLGFAVGASFTDAAAITASVWLGSTLWWIVLTAFLAWVRNRVSTRALTWVNRVSGAALAAFGILAIVAATR
ncbi:MAG TPA: LysE family transporter [Candidatus Limnocylindrales bacterium]|nr:LysE family transporter [Candidatus Limnocylindrales bacterium]